MSQPRTEAGMFLADWLATMRERNFAGIPRPLEVNRIEAQAASETRRELRERIETLDHDYMLHVNELSDADQWTDDQMQTYAATVAGVLRLVEEGS